MRKCIAGRMMWLRLDGIPPAKVFLNRLQFRLMMWEIWLRKSRAQ